HQKLLIRCQSSLDKEFITNKGYDEFSRLEKLSYKLNNGDMQSLGWLDTLSLNNIQQLHKSAKVNENDVHLYLQLPQFDFPIVYHEIEHRIPSMIEKNIQPLNPISQLEAGNNGATAISEPLASSIVDPDGDRENPVEAKYRRLIRSHRSGLLDRELKPNPKIRDDLNVIINYPPTKELSQSEKNLIWKFRFYLARDKRALTKFLKSVTWTDTSEVHQAVDILLPLWTEPDTEDALELLGPGFVNPKVRSYGVHLLSRADDEEILLYLLQLVQALKFEISKHKHSDNFKSHQYDSGLVDLLIKRAVSNDVLGNNFYWYLMVECSGSRYGKLYARVAHLYLQNLVQTPDGPDKRETIKKQAELVETLNKIAKKLRSSKDPRPKKIETLRHIINDSRKKLSTLSIPLPIPVDSRIKVKGIDADQSSVFKSNLFPMLLYFQEDGNEDAYYPVIFKDGDDLRQDQLVVQLFTLMDRLLRKENLDLRLKLFKVLATDTTAGMVQYIPNKTLSTAVNDHGNLLSYLRYHHPNESSLMTYGVEPAILDNFVRSCAGYCVMTFLLGVGDRHLDNLLLCPDGHFFHVDFGYILGRDPKPFPPLLKISKEMVDGMGGPTSPHYHKFKNLCFTAYTTLRKNSNLILNLIALMINANIPDIQIEPDKAVLKVQEKFRLDLSEEDAIKHFEALLNETSYLSAVFDQIHNIAQYWRS
ncbi:phosphatidylinositol 3-kinase, partial [Wallemia mellicola]